MVLLAVIRKVVRLRYIGIGLAAIVAVGFFYLLVSTLQVAAGVSREAGTPDYLVRLQIVNGSGNDGLTRQVATGLAELSDARFDVTVVTSDEFKKNRLPETLIVSRVQDKTAARMLARQIGLDPDRVTYEPLDHNSELVSATLILGADYEQTQLCQLMRKEVK